MKITVFTLLVSLNPCYVLSAMSNETTRMLRQRVVHDEKKNRRQSVEPCVAVEILAQYQDKRHVDEPLGCELQGEDLNGRQYRMIKIKGLTSSWARRNNVTSGVTTIFAPGGAIIDDQTNELVIPSGRTIKLGRHKENRNIRGSGSSQGNMTDPSDLFWNRKLLTTGKRTVIVIRIKAKDAATTATEAQLADDIFGASGDRWNLKTGYAQCSYGQLQFEPLTTNAHIGRDGVYTVNLPNTIVRGKSREVICNAALAKATADLGKAPHLLANHVMVCIPPGTNGTWIGYSVCKHWMSVFNDKWCQYPSSQMHEIGHNLNLHHSGEGASQYGDHSGTMGNSYAVDDRPAMCFNGAKTWQLGWHSNFHVDLPVGYNFNWNGKLVGFAEKNVASVSDRMIIRIRGITSDYYVHFNRRIGSNSGTQEGRNQVLVASRVPGTGLAISYLLARLSSGGTYTIPQFCGSTLSLRITVEDVDLRTVPARASVSVHLG